MANGRDLLKGYSVGGETNRNSHPLNPSTIETIDLAMYDWLNLDVDLHCNTNKGWKKTPIVWVGQERAFAVKNNRDLRDKTGTFILPVITLERMAGEKNPTRKGSVWSNVVPPLDKQGGSYEVTRVINQEKTSNFANSDAKLEGLDWSLKKNKKIVYETATIPLPVYVVFTYEVEIKTEFQQQMNELVQPFMTMSGGHNRFHIRRDGWHYEAFFQPSFDTENNGSNLDNEQRVFITKFQVEVLGKLIGEGLNRKQPQVAVRQNIVEVKIPRERVMVGDLDDIDTKKTF